jgi:transposase
VKIKRENWKIEQGNLDASKLVFLDESGVNTGMTRLYGRAIGGNRVVDYTPDIRFQRTSILSSIKLDGTCVPMVYSGALNGELFKKYLEEFLAPTLRAGDIVVMDNLSSHKVDGVIKIIENVGAKVVFLPPYSPDFNPIELMWSKIKTYLRKVKARKPEMLFNSISDSLETIMPSDILGWFSHSGYSTQ